jgi:thiol-disulfide isomerase/thioredoxin
MGTGTAEFLVLSDMRLPSIKFLFLTLLALSAVVLPAAFAHPRITTATETIKLQGLDGHTYDVASMRGNVVLVSFGATWCTPCAWELRALEELKREYASKPVKFFWVSIESEDALSNAKLQRYVKERRLSFPVLRDPEKAAYLQFTARVRLPTIVFFNKQGDIDQPVQFGTRSPADSYKSDVRARLNKLLE